MSRGLIIFILAVVVFVSGLFYAIYQTEDKVSTFQSDAQARISLTPDVHPSQFGLKEGNVIRATNDFDIFILNDFGYKRLFLNWEIFRFYGHIDPTSVISVVPSTRDAFFTTGLYRNCEKNDPEVWALEKITDDAGILHHVSIPSSQALAEDPEFFRKIFCINNTEFLYYPQSPRPYTSIFQIPRYSNGFRYFGDTPTPSITTLPTTSGQVTPTPVTTPLPTGPLTPTATVPPTSTTSPTTSTTTTVTPTSTISPTNTTTPTSDPTNTTTPTTSTTTTPTADPTQTPAGSNSSVCSNRAVSHVDGRAIFKDDPVRSGDDFLAYFKVINDGTRPWDDQPDTENPYTPHRLGSSSPRDNLRWGISRIPLTGSGNFISNTLPISTANGEAEFNFQAKVPDASTLMTDCELIGLGSFDCDIDFEMVEDGVEWFGEVCKIGVPVLAPTPSIPEDPSLTNDSSCSGFAISPTGTLQAGQSFVTSFALTNTGTKEWKDKSSDTYFTPHRLASNNPPDNLTWGIDRVPLVGGANTHPDNVIPVSNGSTVFFNFSASAPNSPFDQGCTREQGNDFKCTLSFGMVEELEERFGPTCSADIIVHDPNAPTPTPTPPLTPTPEGPTPRPCNGSTCLDIVDDYFTINGQKTFLLGASYYDTYYWRASDLQGLNNEGFNLVRVWTDWFYFGSRSLINRDGSLGDINRLISLVDYADSLGIVVDVTLWHAEPTTGDNFGRIRTATSNIATALSGKTNVIYDLANEHELLNNKAIRNYSHSELAELAEIIRRDHPEALITTSNVNGHLISGTVVSGRHRDNYLQEIDQVGVDLVSPHLQRTDGWDNLTTVRVDAIKNHLRSIDKNIPVYLQEECRRDFRGCDDTSRNNFINAKNRAVNAGAAGWVFHTDAGFSLRGRSFFQNLDSVERSVVRDIGN